MPVRQSHIAKGAVKTADIATAAVKTEDIKNDAVTRPKIQNIKYGVVSVDPGSIAADSVLAVTVTVEGLATTDKILALIQGAATAGITIQAAEVSAADTLKLYYLNTTTAAIDPAAHDVLWVQLKA